jgi:SNF2 family DNA or RNA helicase
MNYNIYNNQNISTALNEKSTRMNLTNNPFKIKLKPHQEALLYKVLDIDEKVSYTNFPFGIMSDKPGSGKTYVVLAMIYFAIKFLNSKGANIIVVPHNIYTQWNTSIKKFLGELLTYKILTEYQDINSLYTNPNLLYNYDIILITSLYYDTFASTIKSLKLQVRRVFFDEADTIKNLLAHSIPCGMTWFVSASIKTVFNNKTNTVTIGTYKIHLNQLLNNECHCSPEFIDANIVLPKPNYEYFKCKDFYLDNILTNILTKDQLAFINGHDYSNIKNQCGNATIKETKQIVEKIFITNTKKIHELTEQITAIDKKIKYIHNQQEKNKYLEDKEKLINEKNQCYNITEKIKYLTIQLHLCINCFKKLKSNNNVNKTTFKIDYYETECKLLICNECYTLNNEKEISLNETIKVEDIKMKCLTCNTNHLNKSLQYHTEDCSFNKESETENLNKIKIINKLLELINNKKSKIIIYSQFKGVNNNIKTIINNNNEYLELDGGNIKDLDDILDKFKNNPEKKILLIDNTTFGVGLNIEYTTDIIFFNYIEPKIKEQLIGRAQRLGRTSKLNIYDLLYANEM